MWNVLFQSKVPSKVKSRVQKKVRSVQEGIENWLRVNIKLIVLRLPVKISWIFEILLNIYLWHQ